MLRRNFAIVWQGLEPVKVIPQKLKLPINFFETFPKCPLPSAVSKNTIKMIGYHVCLRDVTGQTYPIYACTRPNQASYPSVQLYFEVAGKA